MSLRWAAACLHVRVNVFQLAPNHIWKAAPGCRIVVVDNGGVRCDIPHDWIVYSPGGHVFVVDRFPPDNRCLIAITCRRVSSGIIAIPLVSIVQEWINGEDRNVLERSEPVRIYRWPLEAAWLKLRVQDQRDRKEKSTYFCVARADRTQALIVLDYCCKDEAVGEGTWQILMETLVVGEYIVDPLTGRKRMKRG